MKDLKGQFTPKKSAVLSILKVITDHYMDRDIISQNRPYFMVHSENKVIKFFILG